MQSRLAMLKEENKRLRMISDITEALILNFKGLLDNDNSHTDQESGYSSDCNTSNN